MLRSAKLLQCISPFMALSGHAMPPVSMSAFGGKADITDLPSDVR